MPELPQYLAGFGLTQNMRLAGYILETINIDHRAMIRYRKYNYPSTLIWRKESPAANCSEFQQQLSDLLHTPRTIYTQYHNPYLCDFGVLDFQVSGDKVLVTSTGICTRQ